MSVIEAHAVEQALPFAPVISERKGSIDDAKKVRFKDFIDAQHASLERGTENNQKSISRANSKKRGINKELQSDDALDPKKSFSQRRLPSLKEENLDQKTQVMHQSKKQISETFLSISVTNIDSQHKFKKLMHNYQGNQQEFLDKSAEVKKVQKILHGNRGLTETFLGPSDKVRELKQRLEQAQKQRKYSIEREKKRELSSNAASIDLLKLSNSVSLSPSPSKRDGGSLSGSGSSSKKGREQDDTIFRKLSQCSSQDTVEKLVIDSTDRLQVLGNTNRAVKPQQRFKPSSEQNWESGTARYREELQNKARQRMEMLNNRKKIPFKQPNSNARHLGMATGQSFGDSKFAGKKVDSPECKLITEKKASKDFSIYQKQQGNHRNKKLFAKTIGPQSFQQRDSKRSIRSVESEDKNDSEKRSEKMQHSQQVWQNNQDLGADGVADRSSSKSDEQTTNMDKVKRSQEQQQIKKNRTLPEASQHIATHKRNQGNSSSPSLANGVQGTKKAVYSIQQQVVPESRRKDSDGVIRQLIETGSSRQQTGYTHMTSSRQNNNGVSRDFRLSHRLELEPQQTLPLIRGAVKEAEAEADKGSEFYKQTDYIQDDQIPVTFAGFDVHNGANDPFKGNSQKSNVTVTDEIRVVLVENHGRHVTPNFLLVSEIHSTSEHLSCIEEQRNECSPDPRHGLRSQDLKQRTRSRSGREPSSNILDRNSSEEIIDKSACYDLNMNITLDQSIQPLKIVGPSKSEEQYHLISHSKESEEAQNEVAHSVEQLVTMPIDNIIDELPSQMNFGNLARDPPLPKIQSDLNTTKLYSDSIEVKSSSVRNHDPAHYVDHNQLILDDDQTGATKQREQPQQLKVSKVFTNLTMNRNESTHTELILSQHQPSYISASSYLGDEIPYRDVLLLSDGSEFATDALVILQTKPSPSKDKEVVKPKAAQQASSLIQSQPREKELQNDQNKKISAFRLPQASGGGDLMPALEKDMLESKPSFRNLSKLFQAKQMQKFYAKNQRIASQILSNIGGENNPQFSEFMTESNQRIVNLQLDVNGDRQGMKEEVKMVSSLEQHEQPARAMHSSTYQNNQSQELKGRKHKLRVYQKNQSQNSFPQNIEFTVNSIGLPPVKQAGREFHKTHFNSQSQLQRPRKNIISAANSIVNLQNARRQNGSRLFSTAPKQNADNKSEESLEHIQHKGAVSLGSSSHSDKNSQKAMISVNKFTKRVIGNPIKGTTSSRAIGKQTERIKMGVKINEKRAEYTNGSLPGARNARVMKQSRNTEMTPDLVGFLHSVDLTLKDKDSLSKMQDQHSSKHMIQLVSSFEQKLSETQNSSSSVKPSDSYTMPFSTLAGATTGLSENYRSCSHGQIILVPLPSVAVAAAKAVNTSGRQSIPVNSIPILIADKRRNNQTQQMKSYRQRHIINGRRHSQNPSFTLL